MKKEQFYELLGDIDEKAVKAAENQPVKRTGASFIKYGLAAAVCVGLVAGGVFAVTHINNSLPEMSNNSDNSDYDSSTADIATEYETIDIYYIKDNEILSEAEYLPCSPEEIFNSWKLKNGIGDEVELISVNIEDNGTESEDSLTANYTVGDTFTLNVTVTENLKNYYDTISKEKLLESLKLTLTKYGDTEFDEYNLIFE